MLLRYAVPMEVYTVSETGTETPVGESPVSLSYRTSEEIEEADTQYTNIRLTGYAQSVRAPAGGFARGMLLVSENGARYRVLVPTLTGERWVLKLERVLFSGEA